MPSSVSDPPAVLPLDEDRSRAGPRVNILLVDDRRENLIALESVLEDLGQNLVSASSGREALKHLLDEDFAVILLDVQMPDMDGFETASLIRARERSRHTPIVFITAINKTDTHVTRGYEVGAVDYVFKPFAPEVLRAKVQAFVELSKKNRELQEEIEHRKRAEEEVRKLKDDLERRVAVRTAELQAANRELKTEIAERKRAEEERSRLLAAEQAARAVAEKAQRNLAFLGEASAALAASLDYETTLQRVARLAVPYLADFCLVDIIDEEGPIRRVAATHADPSRDGLLRGLLAAYDAGEGAPEPATRVLTSGSSEIVPELDESWLAGAALDPGHLRIFRELCPSSLMVVPLVARGSTVGVISFGLVRKETGAEEVGRRYGAEDLALAEDLARRAAAAIDNARLFREVQEAGQRKDEFLAMLAHELRTPLAAVSNADYVLDEIGSDDPRVARLRAIISRQTQHLSRLVDDLLDISRITRGKIELRRCAVELGVIIQRATETNGPLIRQRGHELTISVPAEEIWLEADPTRLEQILSNLLNNAAKYTEPGGRIDLEVEVDGRWLMVDGLPAPSTINHQPSTTPPSTAVIRVRDTGIGIAPELVPRVFDLFTQASRTSDQSQGGLGIGLALVRNLVHMHGGTVSASSEGPGKGSEFVVRLPILKAEGGRMKDERESPKAEGRRRKAEDLTLNAQRSTLKAGLHPSSFILPPSRRVLIVEDSEDAAETLAEILELWGHEVRLARNGAAALEEARAYAPEVVLLDIGLPGMDGYEVARRLRSAEHEAQGGASNGAPPHRILLVALTGFGQQSARQRSAEAGFDLHLTKPVDHQELRRLLASFPA